MTSAAVALRSFEQLIVQIITKDRTSSIKQVRMNWIFSQHMALPYQNSLADIMRAGMALNVRIDMRS